MNDLHGDPVNPVNPVNPATQPHGTTSDQIAEMENEGQAQQQDVAQTADAVPGRRERRRRLPGPDDVPVTGAAADQAIDTAGTEAEVDDER